MTEGEKRGIAAAYYTSVEYMDACVGRVLDALTKSGHDDDTLVVYLSDHGYFLGQHGRIEKHSSFEEAIRVPLVMRLPGTIPPKSRTPALVELVDLVPTLFEWTGVSATGPLDGRSLVAVAEGRTAKHRQRVFVEYAQNDEAMVRDERWKLVYERGRRRRTDGYDTGRPLVPDQLRLYDLAADPGGNA